MFTDIVDSTRFWDKHGDTAGRIMLDRHNTLLFPVVEAFKGTIIKTIGDSIMASFKTPKDGVEAAIAMQQQLRKARRSDSTFGVHIRIGVHTGQAIVESNDVFGDTVNVAARVEGAAKSDEILVSEATARKLSNKKTRYGLKKKRHFVPKGKRRRMSVWVCDWSSVQNLTVGVRHQKVFPPNRRQHIELGFYAAVLIFAVFLLFREFLRYFLADTSVLTPYTAPLNPMLKWGLGIGGLIAIILAVHRLKSVSKPPIWIFRILKGGSFFGLFFFSSLHIAETIDLDVGPYWKQPYYRTEHRFVEIIADDVFVRKAPQKRSPIIAESNKNDLYVLIKKVKKKRATYAKVAIFNDYAPYGYILERRPAKIGVPAITLIESHQLIIRHYHLYAFLVGALGFLYGAWSFRLKPL